MALDTYANLKTAIANFLARDDLTSEIDDFIDLTEADFNRRLRVRQMETIDSSFTVDSATESLPTGFLAARSFVITSTTVAKPLQLVSPFQLADMDETQSGTPRTYTIQGSVFRFQPEPDSSYSSPYFGKSEYLPISKIKPVYPQRALVRGLEGYCIVSFTITASGTTKDVSVVTNECQKEFARTSVIAANKFLYRPRIINGVHVEVQNVRNKFTYKITD